VVWLTDVNSYLKHRYEKQAKSTVRPEPKWRSNEVGIVYEMSRSP